MSAEHALPVLVVIVNNATDWDHIQADHWYRIPLKYAPTQLAASFLAFYQTRRFGTEACAIRYYAPVLRYRQALRRELLPDAPNHPRAADLYYCIELGPLIELARPISSGKPRRITFIPTTLGRLLAAHEVNDLWLHTATADIVWAWFPHAGIKAEKQLEMMEDTES